MTAKIEVIKILAYGTYHRYMTIEKRNGKTETISISDELYQQLKEQGIPTAQSLRWKK